LTKENLITKLLGWKIHDQIYLDVFKDLEVVVQKQSILKTALIMVFGKISQRLKIPVCSTYFFSESFKDRYLTTSKHLFGYFQSRRYLESNQKEVQQIAKALQRLYMSNKQKDPYVAVHYRYGDSNWAKEYEDYYTTVKQNIQQNKDVVILTDSKDRAKEFFKDLKVSSLKVMSNTPILDFSYMLGAQELYCAPSTFSWWASQTKSNTERVFLPYFLKKKLGFFSKSELIIS
tara:strand:- start:4531 stop:5226 length:696 start_codon:yes stop_codon:yes gene_type:complete